MEWPFFLILSLALASLIVCPNLSTAQTIPPVSIACPVFELADGQDYGDVNLTVAGVERVVRIWLREDRRMAAGPVLFYWHGTGGRVITGPSTLGTAQMDDLEDKGGILIAPFPTGNGGPVKEWPCQVRCERASFADKEDLYLVDQLLACLVNDPTLAIDTAHIHSFGMSAGGLMSSQLAFLRSNYFASVVPMSGGFYADCPGDCSTICLDCPQFQDPMNKLASLLYHGGENDTVGMNFLPATEHYRV